MAILAIDTSTKFAALALSCNDQIVSVVTESPNSHIEKIAELYRELITKAEVEPEKIRQIILGRGPGSFTGLRIGYAFASGLAMGLQIPVIEACSFQTQSVLAPDVITVVLADAGRQEFFAGIYLADQVLKEPEIISQPNLVKLVEELREANNVELNNINIVSNLELGEILSADYTYFKVSNIAVGLLDEKQPNKQFNVLELATLEPNYLRPVAALKISERK